MSRYTSADSGKVVKITGEAYLRVQAVVGTGSITIEGNQDGIGYSEIKTYTGSDGWEKIDVANCEVKFTITGDAVLSVITT